jgi:hypothetical protein
MKYALSLTLFLSLAAAAGAQAPREGLTPPPPDLRDVLKRLDTMAADMQAMRQDIDALKAKPTVSLKPPVEQPSLTPPAGGQASTRAAMGTVTIHNAYYRPATIRLGCQDYTVEPGRVLSVPTPAGEFTYEMRGTRDPKTRALHDGETYRLTVEDAAPAATWSSSYYGSGYYRSYSPTWSGSYYVPGYTSFQQGGGCQPPPTCCQ